MIHNNYGVCLSVFCLLNVIFGYFTRIFAVDTNEENRSFYTQILYRTTGNDLFHRSIYTVDAVFVEVCG